MQRNVHTKHGYRGVHFDQARDQFRARITQGESQRWLGRFATAKEAALAYDRAARETFGVGALVNFQVEVKRDWIRLAPPSQLALPAPPKMLALPAPAKSVDYIGAVSALMRSEIAGRPFAPGYSPLPSTPDVLPCYVGLLLSSAEYAEAALRKNPGEKNAMRCLEVMAANFAEVMADWREHPYGHPFPWSPEYVK